MAKELEKTLQVDGEVYNINAQKAEKVEHSLSAKRINLLADDGKPNTEYVTSDFFEYDGSSLKEPVLVPASGGRFKGRITVPSVSADTLLKDGQTVVNYNDMVNRVVERLINTSTMATWNNKDLSFVNTDANVNGLCVVLGPGVDNSILNFAQYNFDNKILPYYLYISTDTGNLWLGDYSTTTVKQVAYTADGGRSDTADRLTTPRKFTISLSSGDSPTFDGSADVTLGVTGALPIGKGGTGGTTAAEARTNLGITPANIGASAAGHTHSYAGSASVGGPATSAIKATQDGSGNTITSYYQQKILTGTVDPASSTVTAVKNAPNGAIYIKY